MLCSPRPVEDARFINRQTKPIGVNLESGKHRSVEKRTIQGYRSTIGQLGDIYVIAHRPRRPCNAAGIQKATNTY